MTRWTFNRTYYGDPNTHKSSEIIGRRDHHVELAEYTDGHGNTKVEIVESHSSPGALAGPWTLIDTYVGDPETGQHNNVVGYKPYHRRLGRYINQHGKTKTKILDEEDHDQHWRDQKREYKHEQAKKRQERQQARQTAHAPSCTDANQSISLAEVTGISYKRKDGTRVRIDLNEPEK